jgi:hypothetical protein
VSRVHRLMDPGIVSVHHGPVVMKAVLLTGEGPANAPWHASSPRLLRERENGRAVKWNGGRILRSSAWCSK